MPENPGEAIKADGKAFKVSEVLVDYKYPHPQLPQASELLNTTIELGVVKDGYVAPRPGAPVVRIRLADIGKGGPQQMYQSGVKAIYDHLLHLMNARGIIGVFVVVDITKMFARHLNTDALVKSESSRGRGESNS